MYRYVGFKRPLVVVKGRTKALPPAVKKQLPLDYFSLKLVSCSYFSEIICSTVAIPFTVFNLPFFAILLFKEYPVKKYPP